MLQTRVSQPRLRDFHAVNGYLPPHGALRALELGWQRLVPCVSNLRRSAVRAIGGDAISGSAPRPSGTGGLQTLCWRKRDSNLYGAFPVKGVVLVLLRVLCSERESRSSSRRLRSGSRSARKGSRDRNASKAWRLAALAWLVFRSASTPEHAER